LPSPTTGQSSETHAAKPAIQKINLLNQNNKLLSFGDTDTYDTAFHFLSKKHFNRAQKSFQKYLKIYPNGHFAPDAHFWLGEIGLMHQKYPAAIQQFQIVVKQFPYRAALFHDLSEPSALALARQVRTVPIPDLMCRQIGYCYATKIRRTTY